MSRNKHDKTGSEFTFDDACDRMAGILRGAVRREIVDEVMRAGSTEHSLAVLRSAMRAHNFPRATDSVSLRRLVDKFDSRSRKEGLHVLEGWDYLNHRFPDDIAPVLLLDYCARLGIPAEQLRHAVEILLDQYFFALLILLSVRVWDSGNPNENLDRVTGLLADLHGPDGSGLRIADDADTLLLLAIAYYNPEESSFGLLMGKVRQLDDAHRLGVALPFAGVLGSHLRWGLRFMYRRDVQVMRDDNVVDYPMLLFALRTLLLEYARICDANISGPQRDRIVEGLLNGFACDPWAFTGVFPKCLEDDRAQYDETRELLGKYRTHLVADAETHRPAKDSYSPLGFGCNFLSNAAVGMVAIGVVNENAARQPSLNALFSRDPAGINPEESAEWLARGLMQFASAEPERLGARGAPLIAYDPYDAVYWFNELMRTL